MYLKNRILESAKIEWARALLTERMYVYVKEMYGWDPSIHQGCNFLVTWDFSFIILMVLESIWCILKHVLGSDLFFLWTQTYLLIHGMYTLYKVVKK